VNEVESERIKLFSKREYTGQSPEAVTTFSANNVHQVVEEALKWYILNLKVQVPHYLEAVLEP